MLVGRCVGGKDPTGKALIGTAAGDDGDDSLCRIEVAEIKWRGSCSGGHDDNGLQSRYVYGSRKWL